MDFLNGWAVTPDTLIVIWFGIQLTRMLHQHDKRITSLEEG